MKIILITVDLACTIQSNRHPVLKPFSEILIHYLSSFKMKETISTLFQCAI